MHYLLILLTAPSCHSYQNYLPFHSLESVKETKKENSTISLHWLNQFHEGLGNTMHTLYTVKKKRNDLELYQKFVYDVAQKFLQDFNFADQQFFNVGIYSCYGKSLVFLVEIFRESCLGGLLQLHLWHAVEILKTIERALVGTIKCAQQNTVGKKIWLSTHPRNFGSDKIISIYVCKYVRRWGENLHFTHFRVNRSVFLLTKF